VLPGYTNSVFVMAENLRTQARSVVILALDGPAATGFAIGKCSVVEPPLGPVPQEVPSWFFIGRNPTEPFKPPTMNALAFASDAPAIHQFYSLCP